MGLPNLGAQVEMQAHHRAAWHCTHNRLHVPRIWGSRIASVRDIDSLAPGKSIVQVDPDTSQDGLALKDRMGAHDKPFTGYTTFY